MERGGGERHASYRVQIRLLEPGVETVVAHGVPLQQVVDINGFLFVFRVPMVLIQDMQQFEGVVRFRPTRRGAAADVDGQFARLRLIQNVLREIDLVQFLLRQLDEIVEIDIVGLMQ